MSVETKSIDIIEHYFHLNRYEQVIKLVTEELSDNPEDAYLWYLLAYSNYALDEFEEAEEQLFEALRLGYDAELVSYILGRLYLETERWQESEEMFLEALRLNPNDAENHAFYALLMKKTGNKKKAKLLIKKAVELEPENPVVLRLHYFLEDINKSNTEQVVALEQYVNAENSELAKSIQLGLNELFRNNLKEAKEHIRHAFLLQPEDKNLLAILEDLEVSSHPLLAPNRLMEKIGGPAVLWVIGIGIGFLLFFMGFDTIGLLWIQLYVIIALYSWISMPLVKLIRKVKG